MKNNRSILREKIKELKWDNKTDKKHSDYLLGLFISASYDNDEVLKTQLQKLFNRKWKWMANRMSINKNTTQKERDRLKDWEDIKWFKDGVRRFTRDDKLPKSGLKIMDEMYKKAKEYQINERKKVIEEYGLNKRSNFKDNRRNKLGEWKNELDYTWEEGVGIIEVNNQGKIIEDDDEF